MPLRVALYAVHGTLLQSLTHPRLMNFKQHIHSRYLQLVQDRIDALRDMISQLTGGAQNDARGSAGDKHQTGLSMMHLEQERLSAKLREYLDLKAVLTKIDPEASPSRIALGSLVCANGIWLYVSAALPKITVENKTILAISPSSPLGAQLMGQEAGAICEVQGKSYTVQQVL